MVGKRTVWCCFLLMCLLALVAGRPQQYDEDQNHAAQNDDVSRVQIKVYRGPTKHDGYAPWGFWVKQPSDDQ